VSDGIRFGLAGVKNVGEGAIESILEAREEGGAFQDLYDFAARIDSRRVNRKVVESLVKCGAFDSLHENRASVFASLDSILEAGASAQRDREVGQESLFSGLEGAAVSAPPLLDAAPWTDRQRLDLEKEMLGFYVSGHPLAALTSRLDRFTDAVASDTGGLDGRDVWVGGLVTSLRQTRTRRGSLMAFATLEDMEGSFDLVVFAETYARYGNLLRAALEGEEDGGQPLLVQGKLEAGDPAKVLVQNVLELERAEERLATSLDIEMRSDEATADRLSALREILASQPGECAVRLALRIPTRSETWLSVGCTTGVRPNPDLLKNLDALFGRSVTRLRV